MISSWAQGIIIAVIIGTIIEMLLPENNNSKYVKVVIGIFVLFSIVAPVIAKISNNKTDINSIINLEDYDLDISNENISTEDIEIQKNGQIKQIYKENIEMDIQTKVQIKGYKTEAVCVELLNDDNFTISKVEIKIIEKNKELENKKQVTSIVNNIESVRINLSNKKENTESILTEKEKNELKRYLSDVYQLKQDSIVIN